MADTPSRGGVVGTYLQTVSYRYGAAQGQGSGWFGPLQPMRPTAPPEVAGRSWDYPSGFNLDVQPRRRLAETTFADLRALAQNYDLLRLAIETRKDQIGRMSWSVKNRDAKAKDKNDTRVKALTAFFQRPDGVNNWHDWLRPILEDLFVIDAPALYKQRDKGGKLIELIQLDGATIKPIIDDWGRTPRPYSDGSALVYPPAYQQVLKGIPAVDYSIHDLLYRPRNRRVHTPFGYSPVEQIMVTVNIALRRQISTLSYFTEGNIPDMIIQAPAVWTPDQISAFQNNFDALFTGDLAARRRAKFVPGGAGVGGIHETRQVDLKGEFDEWLAKIVCFAFSVSPQALTRQMNRASADTQKAMSEQEGLEPVLIWLKALIDDVILFEFGFDDLEFAWNDDDEVDASQQMATLTSYVSKGILTINEARDDLGKDPLDDPEASQAMIITGSGAVPLGSFQQQQDQAATSAKLIADAQAKQQAGAPPRQQPGQGGSQPRSAPPQRGSGGAQAPADVEKFNTHHGADGRFASEDGAADGDQSLVDRAKSIANKIQIIAGLSLFAYVVYGVATARDKGIDPRDGTATVYQSGVDVAAGIARMIKNDIVPREIGKFKQYLGAEKSEWSKTLNSDGKAAAGRMAGAVRSTIATIVHDSVVSAIGYHQRAGERPFAGVGGRRGGLSAEINVSRIKRDREAAQKAQEIAFRVINRVFRTARTIAKAASGDFEEEVVTGACAMAHLALYDAVDGVVDVLGGGDLAELVHDVGDELDADIDAAEAAEKLAKFNEHHGADGRFAGADAEGKSSTRAKIIAGAAAVASIGAIAALALTHKKTPYRSFASKSKQTLRTASQDLHERSVTKPFAEAEDKAVSDYADGAHAQINKDLRLGRKAGRLEATATENLDSAIDKTSLPENTILYRGLNKDRADRLMNAGAEFTDHGFVSTTISPDVALRYAGQKGYVVSINAPKGSKALPLGEHHGTFEDNEVVLPRSSRFKILRVDHDSQTIYAQHLGVGVRKVAAAPALDDESGKFVWDSDALDVSNPTPDDTTAEDYADYVPPQPDDVAKAFDPSEARDTHGEWTSDGGSSELTAQDSKDWHDAKEAAFSVAKGVALVAVAGLAAAFTPEIIAGAAAVGIAEASAAAALPWIAGFVNYQADVMFFEAATRSGKIVLRSLGVDIDKINDKIKSTIGVDKAVGSAGIDEQLRQALIAVSNHTRDVAVAELRSKHKGADNLESVCETIDKACDRFKDRIVASDVSKRAPGGATDHPFGPAAANAETGIGGRLAAALRKTGKRFAAALRSAATKMAKAEPDPEDIEDRARHRADDIVDHIDLSDLQDQAAGLGDDLEPVVDAAVSRAVAQIGPSDAGDLVNQVNARAVTFARARAAELVGMRYDDDGNLVPSRNPDMAITDTTRDMLRQTIADGLAAGKTMDEIADDIGDAYAFSDERAALIAATEVSRANSMASLESYKAVADLGIAVRKAWLVTTACCDVCAKNEAAGPIDLDEEFPSGDETPPGHPNCRCALTPFVGDTDDNE